MDTRRLQLLLLRITALRRVAVDDLPDLILGRTLGDEQHLVTGLQYFIRLRGDGPAASKHDDQRGVVRQGDVTHRPTDE